MTERIEEIEKILTKFSKQSCSHQEQSIGDYATEISALFEHGERLDEETLAKILFAQCYHLDDVVSIEAEWGDATADNNYGFLQRAKHYFKIMQLSSVSPTSNELKPMSKDKLWSLLEEKEQYEANGLYYDFIPGSTGWLKRKVEAILSMSPQNTVTELSPEELRLTPEEISEAIQLKDGKWLMAINTEDGRKFLTEVAESVAEKQVNKVLSKLSPKKPDKARVMEIIDEYCWKHPEYVAEYDIERFKTELANEICEEHDK